MVRWLREGARGGGAGRQQKGQGLACCSCQVVDCRRRGRRGGTLAGRRRTWGRWASRGGTSAAARATGLHPQAVKRLLWQLAGAERGSRWRGARTRAARPGIWGTQLRHCRSSDLRQRAATDGAQAGLGRGDARGGRRRGRVTHPLPAWAGADAGSRRGRREAAWRRERPGYRRERRSACLGSWRVRTEAARRRGEMTRAARPRMRSAAPALPDQRPVACGGQRRD